MVKLPATPTVRGKRLFPSLSVLGLALWAGFWAVGCQKDATQLVVLVNTDYQVPTELAFVVVRITDLDGNEISMNEFTLTDVVDPADPTRFTLPLSFGVVPVDDDASRRIVVSVDGLSPTREVRLTRLAITGFVSQRTLLLPMFLAKGCEGITCTEPNQTCTEQGCVSAVLEPGSLQEVLPGGELLDAGGPDATADGAMPNCSSDGCGCSSNRSCDFVCGAEACTASCQNNSTCTTSVGSASTFTLQCANTARCEVDARMATDAQISCGDNAMCIVDCRDASHCVVACTNTAECTLQCAGSADCQISDCRESVMSCPGEVQVCGIACP